MKLHTFCFALSTMICINANDDTSSNSETSRSESSREDSSRPHSARIAYFIERKRRGNQTYLNKLAVICAEIKEENGKEYLIVDESWKALLRNVELTKIPRESFYVCRGPARAVNIIQYRSIISAIEKVTATPKHESSDCIII